jgi:hypothetical protein
MQPFSLKNATRTQISIRSSITILLRTGVAPATYRLDAFRKNYRKGGLIGTYVYLSFQKPFRESPSSGTSHSRSRGKLHDRNGKTAATKIPRSAGDAARLCTRYHLPSSLDGAECHHDPQKRLTRRRQQQADDTHSSLIKLRGFGLSAGHFTLSHYAKLFSETENDALCAIRGRSSCFLCENTKRIAGSSKPQVFFRKCAPASSLSSASCPLGVTSTPFSHCTAPWRSSSSPTPSSSFPTPQSTSSPPDTWRPVPNHQFQARKKLSLAGEFFHSADAEIILRS